MKTITVRPFLQSHKTNKEGKSPIAICVTAEGKRTYRSSGLRCFIKDWDTENKCFRKSVTNGNLLNSRIKAMVSEIEADILKRQLQGKKVTTKVIYRQLRGGEQSQEIYEYAIALVQHLEKKMAPATIQVYNNEIDHLNEFAPGITFEEVDPAFLRRYESHLIDGGLSNNSIHKNWKIIKRIFNCAINDEITRNYPFKKYDNPKYRQTDRTYLTMEEVEKIVDALSKPLSEGMIRTGYYFLLGCYSGLRYSDWKRFNYSGFIHGDRMILRAKKNGELISMQMHSRLIKVVEKLKEIGPVDEDQTCNEYLKSLATAAGIKKNITTHVGRHSFAIRCAELGISIETTSELMGITVKACQEYYKVTKRKLDLEFSKWDNLESR